MLAQAKIIAQDLCDQLRNDNDFIGLYLYGSQINGNANADSDIDIAAIFANDKDNDRTLSAKILDLDLKYDAVIDFQRLTPIGLRVDRHYGNEIKKGLYYAGRI